MENGEEKLLPRAELVKSAHRFLDAQNFDSTAACLEQLAARYGKKPETATDIMGILNRLPAFGARLATGLAINTMKAAPENSPLQQKLAAKLLSFAFLEDTGPMLAAEAATQAALKLPSGSDACEAAVDTVLDLTARTPPENTDKGFTAAERLKYVKAVTKRTVAGSDLQSRGLDLWLAFIGQVTPDQQARESVALTLASPPGSAIAVKAAHQWSAALHERLASDPKSIEDIIPDVIKTVSSPEIPAALEKEANEMWMYLYRKTLRDHDSEQALYMAAYTSGKIYENSKSPQDCAQIKELVAASLLRLVKNSADPVFLYEAVMAAAEYDGENHILHKNIARALNELLEDSSYRQDQEYEIYRRLQDHKPPSSQRPGPPPPSPGGP